jgi:hypothetical protein
MKRKRRESVMKKILCISLAVLFIIVLSACVKKPDGVSSSASPEITSPETAVTAAGPDTASSGIGGGQVSSDSIIAESSNTVSDKEIEAILDDLSGELDGALSDAENLEDLDDTDLDLDNID